MEFEVNEDAEIYEDADYPRYPDCCAAHVPAALLNVLKYLSGASFRSVAEFNTY